MTTTLTKKINMTIYNIFWKSNSKDTICFQNPKIKSMAQRAQNNEFVDNRLETKLSMS